MQDAFLCQIIENPEDLVTRRAFADWLMEQPDPALQERGEFIALQFALADRVHPGQRRQEMEHRQAELLARYRDVWTAPLRHQVRKCFFRYGMVESVVIDGASFLAGEQLFQHAPITEVGLMNLDLVSGTGTTLLALAGSPLLQRLSALDLSRCHLSASDLNVLFLSPHLTRIRRLNLDNSPIGDSGLQFLARWPGLKSLTHLSLVRTQIGTRGIRSLLLAVLADQPLEDVCLEYLNVRGNPAFGFPEPQALLAELSASLDPARPRRARQLLRRVEHRVRPQVFSRFASALNRARPGIVVRDLRHSRSEVRRAAAALLSPSSPGVEQTIAVLIRRFFETGVQDAAAVKLAQLRPHLAHDLRPWLDALTENPAAEQVLHNALENTSLPLPSPVQTEFAALCQRRLAWRTRHGRATPAPPVPAEAALERSVLRELVRLVALKAEEAAVRHADSTKALDTVPRKSRNKECAWLIAQLFRLLQEQMNNERPGVVARHFGTEGQ
jgi:uncharacterized protein (TIGR02996 family)